MKTKDLIYLILWCLSVLFLTYYTGHFIIYLAKSAGANFITVKDIDSAYVGSAVFYVLISAIALDKFTS